MDSKGHQQFNNSGMVFADIFQHQSDDRRKFLFHFEQFVKHLRDDGSKCCRKSGGNCHNIDEIVGTITENLLHSCSPNVSDLKFELLLFSIPWSKYLYPIGTDDCCLNFEIFCKFLVEYIQIFPNKCEKFIVHFLFLFRGDPRLAEQSQLSDDERVKFGLLKETISFLLKNITNFERVFSKLLKSRFPYLQNTDPHHYICYCYNYIVFCDLVSQVSATELFEHLFMKILQIDLKSFFDELSESSFGNKENQQQHHLLFEFEFDSVDLSPYQSVENGDQLKKIKILDSIFRILFDFIDSKPLKDGSIFDESDSKNNYFLKIFTTVFFQHLLTADSQHVQYLVFYLCGRSRQFCDAFVNDLWLIATSSSSSYSLAARQGAVSYLLSLMLNARFVNLGTIFSFLKILLQWLNAYLDSRTITTLPDSLNDNDIVYYICCIGFCRLFCTFHLEMDRIHIDCLKNMDLKRALFNHLYSPLQFMQADLRDQFVTVINYYRIGYSNLSEIKPRRLAHLSVNYRENTPKFASIYLHNVRSKIITLVRNLDMLAPNSRNSTVTHSSPIKNEFRSRNKSGGGYNFIGSCRESIKSSPSLIALATSPSSADDGLLSSCSPSNNSLTPSTSFIMNQMLSDMETN